MQKLSFLLLASTLFLFACVRQPNIQGKGELFIQGVWKEDTVANSKLLKTYTQHQIKFDCDSFYAELTTFSKINLYEAECYNNGVWKEYVKGVYAVKKDTLYIGGTFTKENFKQKLTGCYRNGRYDRSFLIKKADSNQLTLESLNDQRITTLSLKEKTTCIQKAL